jgi:hypothetical protein
MVLILAVTLALLMLASRVDRPQVKSVPYVYVFILRVERTLRKIWFCCGWGPEAVLDGGGLLVEVRAGYSDGLGK